MDSPSELQKLLDRVLSFRTMEGWEGRPIPIAAIHYTRAFLRKAAERGISLDGLMVCPTHCASINLEIGTYESSFLFEALGPDTVDGLVCRRHLTDERVTTWETALRHLSEQQRGEWPHDWPNPADAVYEQFWRGVCLAMARDCDKAVSAVECAITLWKERIERDALDYEEMGLFEDASVLRAETDNDSRIVDYRGMIADYRIDQSKLLAWATEPVSSASPPEGCVS